MSEVDEIKEFIGYLKAIFALILAITVGLISWLVQNYNSTEKLLVYADFLLITILIIALILINRKILSDIRRLRDL